MVQRALSLRRGNPIPLEIDTVATAASTPAYSTIPVHTAATTATRRDPQLPHSRHHQLRRSSSVSSRVSTASSRDHNRDLYDGGSVVILDDDIDEEKELEGEREGPKGEDTSATM
ncbi:uncharacterized protein B0T15DRAFT_495462 [Chaetomium strumarium]|uniref:Uncharacterized protein n=1 Tax=Chaetomium strumarium TaxID=1170767 RepID=A0AAJ0GMW1_9PEZI|nr:hypothetical protein B0T15DRAFT_495462 [Chaetomium strumarium]